MVHTLVLHWNDGRGDEVVVGVVVVPGMKGTLGMRGWKDTLGLWGMLEVVEAGVE